MFYFLRKLPVPLFKKLIRLLLFEIKNFLTYHKIFYYNVHPPFWKMGYKCHDIAKSAGSQTNNKSSKHNSMTAEFCKNLSKLSKDLSKRLQTWDLRKRESIRKISNSVEEDASAQSPF